MDHLLKTKKESKNLKKQEIQDIFTDKVADKFLRDKALNIPKDPKYDGYQIGLASMVYKFFDKKFSASGIKSMQQNEQVAEELHKPIIRQLKKKCIQHSKTIFWVLI